MEDLTRSDHRVVDIKLRVNEATNMTKSVSYRSVPQIGGSIHVEDWKRFVKSFRDLSRSKLKDLGLSSVIDVKKMAKEAEKVLQKPYAIPMPHKRQEIQLGNPICELRN